MPIAVIGLGAMGSRIAGRLLNEGEQVTVWNRSGGRDDSLAAAGAQIASSPAEAAASAPTVITVLADEPALVDVTSSPHGLRQGLRAGQTMIEMSTVGPSAIHRLRELLPAGVNLVDAPVLGSISEAEEGTLQIFVGGTTEIFASIQPVLERLGTAIHVGPLGSGAAIKLVANATLLGTLSLLGEITALADRLGLDRDNVFDVLSSTPLGPQADRRRPVVDGNDVPTRFRLALAAKDAELIVDEGKNTGTALPGLEATATWFRQAITEIDDDLDYSLVLRHVIRAAHTENQ